jgi:hypothetical protein
MRRLEMKEIIEYQCEICGEKYADRDDAISCESKVIPKVYPIGMMFSMPYIKEIQIVFAVIKQSYKAYGHNHSYLTWACRDGGKEGDIEYGDNTGGKDYCGLDSWSNIRSPDKNIPAYKRMLIALKKADIESIDYNENIYKTPSMST